MVCNGLLSVILFFTATLLLQGSLNKLHNQIANFVYKGALPPRLPP